MSGDTPMPGRCADSVDERRLTTQEEASLWNMEEQFWTGGLDSARATTAKAAVMILPYPAGILQGDRLWTRLEQGSCWRSVAMTDRRFSRCGDLVVLAYRVSAEKPDTEIYKAVCAATYLREEDRWLRMSHQQTPVD